MKNKLFICIVAALAFVGCGNPATPSQIASMHAENQNNSSNPTLVASTPQGNLYLIFIRPDAKYRDYDRVYFFDTNTTVSINADVKRGKRTVTETSVIINGKEYVPKN